MASIPEDPCLAPTQQLTMICNYNFRASDNAFMPVETRDEHAVHIQENTGIHSLIKSIKKRIPVEKKKQVVIFLWVPL